MLCCVKLRLASLKNTAEVLYVRIIYIYLEGQWMWRLRQSKKLLFCLRKDLQSVDGAFYI